MNSKLRLLAGFAICLALALTVAACGGGSSSSSSSAETTEAEGSGSESAETAAAESGEEESGEEAKTSFTYGYSIATGQNTWMKRIAEVAMEKADAAGGEGELADSKLEPSLAVTQIKRFASEGDEVIAVAPAQVPQAVQSTLTQAAGEGKKIFGLEWSFPANGTGAPEAPVQGQVNIDRQKLGEEVSEAINEETPEGGKVIYIGLPYPVVGVDKFQEAMEESLGKSELVDNVDNPSDNAQGALGPLSGALSANPDATAIVTYNGPSAEAAIQAVKQAGMTGKVGIYNIQLDSGTAKALKEGEITAAWDINPVELGSALGELIAAAGTGAPESEWNKTVVIPPTKYTQENIGSWEDWAPGA
jgi:ABC-type sugar transport system substrate-binding protein